MRRLLDCTLTVVVAVVVAVPPSAAAEPQLMSQDFIDQGWLELFDGQSLLGWQTIGEAEWNVADGAIFTQGEKPGWLMTTAECGNFELHVEFKAPAKTNSGIFLRTVLHPTDPTKDCYELNIAPRDNPFPTGSLVGRRTAQAPLDLWNGAWHTFEITANGGKFVIHCDGRMILQYDDPSPIRRGHVGLQSKAGEVSFRNIRLREIGGN
jgi:hypothetical protein